ncbi:hypothetical protein AGMMS4956_20110 [Bacteroidia bacterium]|nr:hypothetical protein AGMMS4956_20110 [Bacteroidia bacterium]
MKKTVIFVVLLFCSFTLFAQIKFGVKAGANIYFLNGSTFLQPDTLPYSVLSNTHVNNYGFRGAQWAIAQTEVKVSMYSAELFRTPIDIPYRIDIKPFRNVPLDFRIGEGYGEWLGNKYIEPRYLYKKGGGVLFK